MTNVPFRSDHRSSKFGQWYTAEQIHDLFAPSDESVEAVRAWLVSAGIPVDSISQSVNKQWMQFDAHVEDAERLLKTKYNVWEHQPTGKMNVACDEYSLPDHVQEHVDYVTPGIKLHTVADTPRSKRSAYNKFGKRTFGATNGKGRAGKLPPLKKALPMALPELLGQTVETICNAAITPGCIRTLYNFTMLNTTAQKDNELGIFEDLGDVYAQEDLDGTLLQYCNASWAR